MNQLGGEMVFEHHFTCSCLIGEKRYSSTTLSFPGSHERDILRMPPCPHKYFVVMLSATPFNANGSYGFVVE